MKIKKLILTLGAVCLVLSGCTRPQREPAPPPETIQPTPEIVQHTPKPNIFDYDLRGATQAERKQFLIDQTSIQNCNLLTVKYLGESKDQGNINQFSTPDGRTLFTTKYSDSSCWGNIYGTGYTLQLNRWVANDVGADVLIYYDGEIPADGNLNNANIKSIIYPGIFWDNATRTMPTTSQLKTKLTSLNTALADYINSLENPQILNFEEAIIDFIQKSGLGGFTKTQTQHNNFYYSNGDYTLTPKDFIVIRDGDEIQYLQFHISMEYQDKNYGKIVYGTDGFTYASDGLPVEIYRGFMTPSPADLVPENRIDAAIEQYSYENCSLLLGTAIGNNAYYKEILQLRGENNQLYTLSKQNDYNCWSLTPGQGNTAREYSLADGDEAIVILYKGQPPAEGNLDKTDIQYVRMIDDYFAGQKINDIKLDELKQYFVDYNNAVREFISQSENQVILNFDEAITAVAQEMGITDLTRYIGWDGQPVYSNGQYTLKAGYLETLVPGSTTTVNIAFGVNVYNDDKIIRTSRCISNGKISSQSYS